MQEGFLKHISNSSGREQKKHVMDSTFTSQMVCGKRCAEMMMLHYSEHQNSVEQVRWTEDFCFFLKGRGKY